jgi:hypothetical protein
VREIARSTMFTIVRFHGLKHKLPLPGRRF